MTPTELRSYLFVLRWTQRGLARALNRQESTVRQWARGVTRIPDDVERWLDGRLHHALRFPAPIRSRPTPNSDSMPPNLAMVPVKRYCGE